MNWRCADPVPRVLPSPPTHGLSKSLILFNSPCFFVFLSLSPLPSFSLLSTLPPSLSLSFFPTLLETVAIISILLHHYNSSGNVRSFSLCRATLTSSRLSRPFYNCFPRYLSILFTMGAFARLLKWRSFSASLKPCWIMRQTSTGIAWG